MNKAQVTTIGMVEKVTVKSVEDVVNQVRQHLKKISDEDPTKVEVQVSRFLGSQGLTRIGVHSRRKGQQHLDIYLRFSLDGFIEENATVSKMLPPPTPPQHRTAGGKILKRW